MNRIKMIGIYRAPAMAAVFLLSFVPALAQQFTKVPTPALPALTNASAQWVDFNNDGLFDLFISGLNSGGALKTSVFTNAGGGVFNETGLTPLADITFDIGDYNNDGYLDIIIAGVTSGGIKNTIVYRNTSGTGFTQESFSLTGLSRGGLIWRDLDSDTDLDILITGLNAANDPQIILYEYRDNAYHVVETGLEPVSNGDLIVVDATNDGHPEVVVTGLNESGNAITRIFSVNADMEFTVYSGTLEGTAFNTTASGDIDGDGYEDIIIAGLAGPTLTKTTSVLKNNAVNDFTSVSTGIVNVASATVDLGDINNDGLADIILTGQDDASPMEFKHFRYYQNAGAFSFADVVHTMPNIYNGDATLGDFDNDGDLDVFQIGNSDLSFESNLYLSDQAASMSNAAPGVPTALDAAPSDNTVTLNWNAPTDDLTSSVSLTYNLYISRDLNGTDLVVSPLSDILTGLRRIPVHGNNASLVSRTLHNLPEGRYYWSVQAIDNAYKASSFAPEQTFSICHDISLGDDVTVCFEEELELQMGEAGDMVNWYSKTDGLLLANSLDFVLQVNENDTIVVELTKPFGCTVKDTLIVTMAALPVIDLGDDVGICLNEEFSKTLTGSYTDVSWLDSDEQLLATGNHYSYVVEEENTITVKVIGEHGCLNYDILEIHVLSLPVFTIGPDQETCFGEEVTFNITGTWPSVEWYTRAGADEATDVPAFSYAVLDSDQVIAKVTDASGCVNYDTAVADVLQLPVVSLGSDKDVCFMESTSLEIPVDGNTVNWYNAEGALLSAATNAYVYEVNETKTFVAEVIDGNSCVNYDTIVINRLALPEFSIGADTAICSEDEITLETGAGFKRVDWFSKVHGTTLQDDSWFYQYTVSATDTIIAQVENTLGCVNYDSIAIEMLIRPVFTLGSDLNICEGNIAELSVDGSWQQVNWLTGNDVVLQQDAPTYSFEVLEDISITAEVLHVNGCPQYDTVMVNMLVLPSFELGPDQTHCHGNELSLDAGVEDVSYEWTNDEGLVLSELSTYNFQALDSIKLFLRATDIHGCQYRDSVSIHVNPLPVFNIEAPAEICEGDEVQLHVMSPWESIVWHLSEDDTIGVDANTINVSLRVSGDVYATLTDVNQCVSTHSVFITVNSLPAAHAGPDVLVCHGETTGLGDEYSNESDLTFEWTPSVTLSGAHEPRPVASPEMSTTYMVTVTDIKGCESIDTVLVEVNPEIIVDAGSDRSICIGDQTVIGGSPTGSGSLFPFTYEWVAGSGDIISTSPSVVVSPQETTTYFVFATTGKCSVEYDSVIVTVNPLPDVQASATQSIGAGGNITLHAEGAVDYIWSPSHSLDDPTAVNPVAFPEVTTTYTVQGTDANGCIDSAQVVVLVQNNLFIPSLFTPNNDGKNDTFKLYGSGVAEISFSIFDQQGNRVFHTEDVTQAFEVGWNGTSKGKVLKNDVYIWTIDGKFFNGQVVRYDGKSNGIIKLMK